MYRCCIYIYVERERESPDVPPIPIGSPSKASINQQSPVPSVSPTVPGSLEPWSWIHRYKTMEEVPKWPSAEGRSMLYGSTWALWVPSLLGLHGPLEHHLCTSRSTLSVRSLCFLDVCQLRCQNPGVPSRQAPSRGTQQT